MFSTTTDRAVYHGMESLFTDEMFQDVGISGCSIKIHCVRARAFVRLCVTFAHRAKCSNAFLPQMTERAYAQHVFVWGTEIE